MSLIGILTEHKNEVFLKKQLEKENWEDVFFLNEKTIENMRNIKFETFLLGKRIESKQDIVRFMAQNSKYFVLNCDIKENLSLLENLDLMLITYGYNSKATITASSIEEGKVMICLQRNITNAYQENIEPQELKVEAIEDLKEEAAMELASLCLLYGKK